MPAEGQTLGRQAGTKTFETNEEGEPIVTITPTETVYSFLFFMAPIEEVRAPGKFTTPKILAWLVVVVALILQSVIIYAVWKVIVVGSSEWQQSVWSPAPTGGACNTGGSLCVKDSMGLVTCAPPSVQLSGRWEELDTDGDGKWTRDEAQSAYDDIYCKYHVNPVEVFDVFVSFLINRDHIIWIHPSIRSKEAIPKSYFTYAKGDIIMCGYRDEKMCPNLMARGFFDAPLTHRTAPRVGKTIQSALEYCYEMLEDGGTCDRTLPSTYTVWKKSSQEQCYGTGYHKFTYEHPLDRKVTKSMLEVDYSATEDYQKADKSTLFMWYKGCVIMVLLCCVFRDLKEIVPLVTLVCTFPSAQELEQQGLPAIQTEVEDEDQDHIIYTIRGITNTHRASLAAVCMARLVMFFVLLWVGIMFLLMETDYLNLILNGLGLLFIVVLPADLYQQLLSPYLRSKVEHVRPVEVPMRGPGALNKNPPLKDILWLAAMLVLLVASMTIYREVVVQPITEALSCACLSEGDLCRERLDFSREFWDKYWQYEVPGTISDIKRLEEDHKAGGAVSLQANAHSEPARPSNATKHRNNHSLHRNKHSLLNRLSARESLLRGAGWDHPS